MRIALAGGGLLGGKLLNALIRSHHQVVGVVQDGRRTRGAKRSLFPMMAKYLAPSGTVLGTAKRHKIPIMFIDKMTEEELAPLRALKPDVLLVGGFAIILKEPLLSLPAVGCVNTHSSLLPKHRGPNPFTAALLAGDAETGVTFHIVDEAIDTGDVVEQFAFPIEANDTAADLHRRASQIAAENVVALMDHIAEHGLQGTPQETEGASYEKKIRPEETFLDWEDTAANLERKVRALYPFSVARFRHGDRTVFVSRAAVDDVPHDAEPGVILRTRRRVTVATGEGALKIRIAYTLKPFPWMWPPLWARPEPGERLG